MPKQIEIDCVGPHGAVLTSRSRVWRSCEQADVSCGLGRVGVGVQGSN
jgi:hypothetical protein